MKQNSKTKRRIERSRSVWSTTFVYVTLIILTALMFFAFRGMITGSLRPYDSIETQAGHRP
jgi:ABC-type glycerol-3-phosphate transport system permease component